MIPARVDNIEQHYPYWSFLHNPWAFRLFHWIRILS